MPQYKGADRRRFVRIPFWFVTKYRVYPYEGGSASEFRHGVGKNISVGGISFETEDGFPDKSILEVELDMPALDQAVSVIGQIVWVKDQNGKHIYGLAFTKIKKQDVEAVKMIVDTFS